MADRALRIAIDGRELGRRPTGVGRYLLEVLRRWAAHPAHRFIVIVPEEPTPALRALGPSISWRVEPAAVAGTAWEQWRLPRALRRERPDVLFAPAYTAPLWSPVPCVLAVYDVSYCAHPEWFGRREGLRRRWLTRAAARRASAVVTISEFSRSEIHRYLDVAPERVVLAPPGAPAAPVLPDERRPPVVLYVGSLFGRRHVPEMIEAFARVRAVVPGARFVLVGDNRTAPPLDPRALAAAAGVAGSVEWREYVGDAELSALYRTAGVFLFLSDYEGFAMTPLEALAHGVPPVLQDTAVSREVYGEAAALVPPQPDAVASALLRMLSDDAARASVLAAGRARLATYSWDATARRVLQAIEEAAR
jgi:glycosyltransferase involved in cell wall biosynthesis